MASALILKLKKKLGRDKDFGEIAKGGSKAFLINLIGLGVGYLFVTLVSFIYKDSSAAIYGQYVLVTLFLRIASIISRCGTDTASLRFTAAFSTKGLWGNIRDTQKKLVTIVVSLGLLITILIHVFAGQLSAIFKLSESIIRTSSYFVLPMALSLFYSQSLRGLKRIGISSFLRSTALPVLNFLFLPIAILFVGTSSSHFTFLPSYTFFAATIIACMIGIYTWRQYLPSSGDVQYDGSQTKSTAELFKVSYPLLLAESMIFIGTWIDQIMLGIMGTNEDVGIFNLCVKYAMVASLSLQAVNTISAPKFSEYYYKKDYAGLAANVKKTTKIIFLTTLPIVILYLLLPKFFLGLFGSSFTDGWPALIFLSLGALFSVMTGSVGVLLQMTGHQKVVQNILLVSIVIEVALNAWLIPLYGVTGAAIASMTGTAIKNFTMSYFVKKYFNFSTIYLPFFD